MKRALGLISVLGALLVGLPAGAVHGERPQHALAVRSTVVGDHQDCGDGHTRLLFPAAGHASASYAEHSWDQPWFVSAPDPTGRTSVVYGGPGREATGSFGKTAYEVLMCNVILFQSFVHVDRPAADPIDQWWWPSLSLCDNVRFAGDWHPDVGTTGLAEASVSGYLRFVVQPCGEDNFHTYTFPLDAILM